MVDEEPPSLDADSRIRRLESLLLSLGLLVSRCVDEHGQVRALQVSVGDFQRGQDQG
jgi:hypothetical protein